MEPLFQGATHIMSKAKIGDIEYDILGTKREVSETAKQVLYSKKDQEKLASQNGLPRW